MAGQYARPVNRTGAMSDERSQATENPVEHCRCVCTDPDHTRGMISDEEAEAVKLLAFKSIPIDLSRTTFATNSWR